MRILDPFRSSIRAGTWKEHEILALGTSLGELALTWKKKHLGIPSKSVEEFIHPLLFYPHLYL